MAFLFGFALSLAAAGCLQQGDATSIRPRSPAGNASQPSDYAATLSQCEMLAQTLLADDAVFRAEYPPDVTPSTANQPLQTLTLTYWSCRQATQESAVFYDLQIFVFGGYIEPLDPEDDNLTYSVYVFEAYTNSRSLAENASQWYGLDLKPVDSITWEKTPLNPPPYPTFAYSLNVPGGPNADYSLRGHMWEGTPSPKRESTGYYFLNSTGQLNHFRLNYEGNGRGGSAGTVTFGPDSYWGRRADVEEWHFLNNAYNDITAELTFHRGV